MQGGLYKGFVLTVSVDVTFKVVGASETTVTDLAPEWSFSSMLPHVSFEVMLEVKPAPADVAHEGSLLCVCLDVALQFGASFEGQIAP